MYFQGVSANVLPSLVYDHEAALARLESLFLRPKGLEMYSSTSGMLESY